MSRAWDKEKILILHEESNLRPSDLRSDALPLSHRDSSVGEVYYKWQSSYDTRQDKTRQLYFTRVAQSAARLVSLGALHTVRISNVDSVLFLDRNSRDGKFWARWRFKKDVFSLYRKRLHYQSVKKSRIKQVFLLLAHALSNIKRMMFLFWANIWPQKSLCVKEVEIILRQNSVLIYGSSPYWIQLKLRNFQLISLLEVKLPAEDSLPISYERTCVSGWD